MAYIIAHGTVNGYLKIQSTLSDNRELHILTDIRTEFNNTATMLTTPEGYILQMCPSGVWISIVKTLIDGERSGNGAGFFAFSAFVPQDQVVTGASLKGLLDRLMQHYIGQCPNFMTKNIGIDWSFVTNASAELNAMCQSRRKIINTHYIPSNNFAYVQATTEEQIIQLLDKPFQPEYGAYKVVFIGTHLQHPMRLPQQTSLNIDLENEEYDIIWDGGTLGFNKEVPKIVRKKEIATGCYTFEKTYYMPMTVKYSEGSIDKVNATLTLKVPHLQPNIYQITLQYNYTEGVGAVVVKNLPIEQIKGSVLTFKGEEFAQKWDIMIMHNENYTCRNFSITPCECQNGIFSVNLIKMQQVSLQIYKKNKNETNDWWESLIIHHKHTNEKIEINTPKGNTLSIFIPEGADLSRDYKISMKSCKDYSIDTYARRNSNSIYSVNIQKRQVNPTPSTPSKTRTIYLDVSESINIKELSATLGNEKLPISEHGQSIKITVANTVSRSDIKFACHNVPIKSKKAKNTDDTIIISLTLWGFIKKNIKLLLLVVGVVILLSICVASALLLSGVIKPGDRFSRGEETGCFIHSTQEEITPPPSGTPLPNDLEEQRLYNELDSILQIQRKKWHYETITNAMSHYDTTSVINPNHKAYKLYKELAWLQCRTRLDGFGSNDDYTKWIQLIKEKGVESPNKEFATKELYDLLNKIVSEKKQKQQKFYNDYVKTKKIEQMTFEDVNRNWSNCKVGGGGGNGNSNKGSNDNNSIPPQKDANNDDY